MDGQWIGRKIYCRLKGTGRAYSGVVIGEDNISITIKDVKGNLVRILFDEAGLLQEEH